MSWKVRHEGSPQAVEGLSLPQVVEGLQDGQWEPTDEVWGPSDQGWTAIENHPQLAEVAEELEPPPPLSHEDETRLDMTALIDVCLVLLVFFILTVAHAALQKMLPLESLFRTDEKTGVKVLDEDKAKEMMVFVSATMEDGKPVIRVGDQVVSRDELIHVLSQTIRRDHKVHMLLKYDPDVPHGTVVFIRDQAKGAGIQEKVYVYVPPQELGR